MAGTKTIKSSGGDYSSVSAWESGEQGNLSGVGEVKGVIYDVNTTTSTTIAGSTNLSASDFRHLTTDSTTRHAGKWDTSKSNFQFSSAVTNVVDIQEAFFQLSYCQLENTNGSPTGVVRVTNVASVLIDQCICWSATGGGDDNAGVYLNSAGCTSIKVRNTVCYGARGGIRSDNSSQTVTMENCAFVGGTKGISTAGGNGFTLKNVYCGGNTSDISETGGSYAPAGWSYTTVMVSAAYSATGLTASIAYSTANFTNVTAGSVDIHLVSGSALIDAGTDLSGTFTVDINGATRSGTWDVGPDEFVAAAAGVTYPQLERFGHRGAFRGMLH